MSTNKNLSITSFNYHLIAYIAYLKCPFCENNAEHDFDFISG